MDAFNLELKNLSKLASTNNTVIYTGNKLTSLEVEFRKSNGTVNIHLSSKAQSVSKFFEDRFGSSSYIRMNANEQEFIDTIMEIDGFLEMFYR